MKNYKNGLSKILILPVLMCAFGVQSAYALTEEQVKIVAPSISTLISSISSFVSDKQYESIKTCLD